MTDSDTLDQSAGAIAGAPAPAPASRWEDFVDIFYAPSAVYARREHSGFGIPMLIVTVLSGLIMLAMFNALAPIFDAEFARGAAAAIKQGATEQQMAAGRKFGEVVVKVMSFIGPPILMFLSGLFLWLFGKIFGARQTLNAAIMVAAYANVPRLIGTLLGGVQALLTDPANLTSRYSVTLSAARFMDPATASPVLLAVAGRLDLFTLWTTVLLAIGLAVTGKISRGKALAAAFLVWVLGALPELMSALRQ
jgi:hypothetical protein